MIHHPFEGGEEPQRQARPLPCTECGSTKGYTRVGNYRVHCKDCNALLKNEEVGMELTTEESK